MKPWGWVVVALNLLWFIVFHRELMTAQALQAETFRFSRTIEGLNPALEMIRSELDRMADAHAHLYRLMHILADPERLERYNLDYRMGEVEQQVKELKGLK